MTILVIGLGSMGKRRIRCLQALGCDSIIGYDPREDRCQEAKDKYGIAILTSDLSSMPDYAFICVPPDLHESYGKFEPIIDRAMSSIPCFVEAGVRSLSYGTPSATMLFHPAVKLIQEHLHTIGKITNVTYHSGQYLPDWHPYEKVSEFYAKDAAPHEMIVFELLWLTKLFGYPTDMGGMRGKTTEIEGATFAYDTYNILFDYPSHLAAITIDVTSRVATRRLVVNGELGQIVWDWESDFVKFRYPNGDINREYNRSKSAQGYNAHIGEQMYVDEVGAFLAHQYPNTLEHTNRVVKIAEEVCA